MAQRQHAAAIRVSHVCGRHTRDQVRASCKAAPTVRAASSAERVPARISSRGTISASRTQNLGPAKVPTRTYHPAMLDVRAGPRAF